MNMLKMALASLALLVLAGCIVAEPGYDRGPGYSYGGHGEGGGWGHDEGHGR